jgi:hypothetical protein
MGRRMMGRVLVLGLVFVAVMMVGAGASRAAAASDSNVGVLKVDQGFVQAVGKRILRGPMWMGRH